MNKNLVIRARVATELSSIHTRRVKIDFSSREWISAILYCDFFKLLLGLHWSS